MQDAETQVVESNQIIVKNIVKILPFTNIFFFLSVLGIDPKASCILGKCATTELHPQPCSSTF